MSVSACARCAAEPEDDELAPVWAEADTPELWCPDCRDRYPHEPAVEDEGAAEP